MPIFRNGSGRRQSQVSSRGLRETQAEILMAQQFQYMAARFDSVAELFVYGLEAYSAAGLLFAIKGSNSTAEGKWGGVRDCRWKLL